MKTKSGFNQSEYIAKFNKENYKMYQFRVKKTETEIIDKLDNIDNRNSYLISLINKDLHSYSGVYTLKEVKDIIKPILNKHGIKDIYLYGDYGRGEATPESIISIYCDRGRVLNDNLKASLEIELEEALHKKIELVFDTIYLDRELREKIREDMIKIF